MRKAISTEYGCITGRDAIMLKNTELDMHGMKLRLELSVDPQSFSLDTQTNKDVSVILEFADVSQISIYRLDDYTDEKDMISSIDVVETECGVSPRYVLGTYDHVFEVTGKVSIRVDL